MPSQSQSQGAAARSSWPFFTILFSLLAPVMAAVLVLQLDSFNSVPYPLHELTHPALAAPLRNNRMLQGSEFVGKGVLNAPEDVVYHTKSGLIYTTCADGWVKRVTVNDSVADTVVEDWINTGGRPLGLVLGQNNEFIVADAYKGLLNISESGEVNLLSKEADGVEFNLTDAVDIGDDGTIYFTDASSKYNLHDCAFDLLEGNPYGRLLSYDPVTKQTKVLLSDLYFANGVTLSSDKQSLIFCETTMRRCRKYYIKGEKKGRVEKFTDNLPGLPDNIHYDGNGHYYIALALEVDTFWEMVLRYPILRKAMAIYMRHLGTTNKEKNAGIFVVDLEGKPTEHYYDPELSYLSTGVKIGDHLYCGSVIYPYLIRLHLSKHPAQPTTT